MVNPRDNMTFIKNIVNPDFYNNASIINDNDGKLKSKIRKYLSPSGNAPTKLQQLERFWDDLKAGKSAQEIRNSYKDLKKSTGYLIEESIYRAFRNSGSRLKEMETDYCFGRTVLLNNDLKEIFNTTFHANNNSNSAMLPEMIKFFQWQKPLKEKLIKISVLSDFGKLYQEALKSNGIQSLAHETAKELHSLGIILDSNLHNLAGSIRQVYSSIEHLPLSDDEKVYVRFLLGKLSILAKHPRIEDLKSSINQIVSSLDEHDQKYLGYYVYENTGKKFDGEKALRENPALLHQKGPNGQKSAIDYLLDKVHSALGENKETFLGKLKTTFINCEAERLSQTLPDNVSKVRPILVGVEYKGLCSEGGLAEAITGMAEAISQQERQKGKARVILPKYSSLDSILQKKNLQLKPVPKFSTPDYNVFKTKLDGVNLYLIDDKRGRFRLSEQKPSVYGSGTASIKTRFACFSSHAADLSLKMSDRIKSKGNIPLVHLHDWHAAGAAQLIKQKNKTLPVVYTYHNNDYGAQGIYSNGEEKDSRFGMKGDNLFRIGLQNADHITTVSKSYAKESMSPDYGFHIDNDIRDIAKQNKLTGITNGSNPKAWNPATNQQLREWKDPETGKPIDLTFSADDPDIMGKKRIIKEQLKKWFTKYGNQYGFHIKIDPNKPLVYFIGRYTGQKGLDLLPAAAEEVLKQGGQFISVGPHNPDDQDGSKAVRSLQEKCAQGNMRNDTCVINDEKNGEAYKIQGQIGALIRAASDFMVVPSRFEPCGLVQYEGWLFGSQVIASKLGGLADTVTAENGTLFERKPNDSQGNSERLKYAIYDTFKNWKTMSSSDKNNRLRNVMKNAAQSSWTSGINGKLSPISQYFCVYDKAIKDANFV
ncbi:MAG: putative glycosidase/glycosyltransferase [Chlamydiales bacterium]|jgi:starch synthase|nr:putative glycosidase/glycosyltransferase [Chlamydiales bacterium]